jgi:archaeosine synthase beta-subunit
VSWPSGGEARDRYVLDLRGPRPRHDLWRYHDLIVEEERAADGRAARVATVFLTGRECPWRCAMCDLWRYTTENDTPEGAIAAQVATARASLATQREPATQMKLYNAGSFFDPRAVRESDYEGVARAVDGLDRVIVESHPALVGSRLDRFLSILQPSLEVAMGLETVHPEALERLNKRMTVDDFRSAAARLAERGVSLRVFLLVSPPFIPRHEQDDWLCRSVDAAFSCGASVVSLIPTREGNGTMERLASEGQFFRPSLDDLEHAFGLALSRRPAHGRVFADLWDLERVARCPHCLDRRRERLRAMNLQQRLVVGSDPACPQCTSMLT